jgi:hypothetical protein
MQRPRIFASEISRSIASLMMAWTEGVYRHSFIHEMRQGDELDNMSCLRPRDRDPFQSSGVFDAITALSLLPSITLGKIQRQMEGGLSRQ